MKLKRTYNNVKDKELGRPYILMKPFRELDRDLFRELQLEQWLGGWKKKKDSTLVEMTFKLVFPFS